MAGTKAGRAFPGGDGGHLAWERERGSDCWTQTQLPSPGSAKKSSCFSPINLAFCVVLSYFQKVMKAMELEDNVSYSAKDFFEIMYSFSSGYAFP